MRSISWLKKLVWAVLLTWPWLVWSVAKSSPEMILKGIESAGSLWMPIFLDVLICLGWLYALRSRRLLGEKPNPSVHKSAIHGPHFKLAAQRKKAKSSGDSA